MLSEDEQKEVLRRYRLLLRHARPFLRSGDQQNVRKAFELSLEAHKDMRRKSGEPYIFHPIAVADICITEIGLGSTSLIAALLHDVVEDTQYTLEDIRKAFGAKIGAIIDGLTKISSSFTAPTPAENFRKVLLTLSKDARVILIKIADRLHNMRTLSSLTRSKQLRIASETIYLYVPIAHRLGLYSIKNELEDLYLKYTDPQAYHEVASKINETKIARYRFIRSFIKPIEQKVKSGHIQATFKGRPKSIYSIWNKMKRQGILFEEVYDLFAIRIIIDAPIDQEKALCWKVYSIITDIYTPNPERLKDWINNPKANGYESLHATIMSKQGRWVEVQIRSQRMDEIAEKGYAAHWKYKSQKDDRFEERFSKLIDKLREVLEHKPESDAIEFLQDFRADLSKEQIYVFTPKGDLRVLPTGSTVLDFAFDIHTDLGTHCIGAKIAHKLFPVHHKVHNGDQIEVISSEKQLPKDEWLEFVVSSKGITSIKHFLRQQRSVHVDQGRSLLERLSKKQLTTLDTYSLDLLTQHFGLKDHRALYHEVGVGHISLRKLNTLDHLLSKLRDKQKSRALSAKKATTRKAHSQEILLIGKHAYPTDYTIAPCCRPLPGEEIFGFITKDNQIRIHRTTCRNAPGLLAQHNGQTIQAQWAPRSLLASLAIIQIKGTNRTGILHDIMRFVSNQEKIETKHVEIGTEDGIFSGEIEFFVESITHLRRVIAGIKKIRGITHVMRTDT